MNDLISRQAAIYAMCELMRHWFGCNPKDEIKEIKRELDKLPAAQPERKGEWLETEFLKLRECSCCHVRWGMYDVENFNYCPNCGADMRGEQE